MDAPVLVTGANFVDFAVHLAVDVLAFTVLGVLVYYRRNGRSDFLICMASFNISLFVVLTVIDVRATSLGVGFGLFALLSIISLRSEPFSLIELGYFFAALVIGVVNGLEVGGSVLAWPNELFAVLLTAVVVTGLWVIDHPRLRGASARQKVTLDVVHPDPAALRADLEQRLGATVTSASVSHTDYAKGTTSVDVRYLDQQAQHPAPPGQRPPRTRQP